MVNEKAYNNYYSKYKAVLYTMKKLLIVVDYQCDFVNGPLGFPAAAALDDIISNKIAELRADGGDIAFTMDGHKENYAETMEGRKLPIPHCIEGTEGRTLYGQTASARRPLDRCILKSTFPALELGTWLKGKDYDEVELCGVVSYQCVLANAVMVKAALPEAEVVVDAKCVAGPDPVLHQKALDVMEALHITVRNR